LEAPLTDLISLVKAHGLEGLVAKRRESRYEPGQRNGEWLKMRVNRGQPFVIAGYTPGARNIDAVIFGYYEGNRLLYAGRTRNGFTPASRDQLYRRLRELETQQCPFANLPEATSGRWGEGLTASKMTECRWLQPRIVGQFEFVEWTPEGHLRHSRFMGLVEQDPHTVRRRLKSFRPSLISHHIFGCIGDTLATPAFTKLPPPLPYLPNFQPRWGGSFSEWKM
jgi:bifunctional non-homologous end joining protein LigD